MEKYINPKNIALENAVRDRRIDQVKLLLYKGAEPNFRFRHKGSMMYVAMENNDIEIIILLLKYGYKVTKHVLNYIFSKNNPTKDKHAEELVRGCVSNHVKFEFMQKIFKKIATSKPEEFPKSMRSSTLKFLIDYRLSSNSRLEYSRSLVEFYGLVDLWKPNKCHTLMSMAIETCDYKFLSMLVKHGADPNSKCDGSELPLTAAARWKNLELVKLFLAHGAKINELNYQQSVRGTGVRGTALHAACERDKSTYNDRRMKDEIPIKIIRLLIEKGADLNIFDTNQKTPLMRANTAVLKLTVIQELAIMKFKNQHISDENLLYIQRGKILQKKFDACLAELEKMQSYDFFHGWPLYYILNMRRNRKKLTLLTRNEEFVTAFRRCNRRSFKYYGKYLDEIFEEALERRDILMTEEKKLKSVFKNYNLPELSVRQIAYYENEDLFFGL